VQAGYTFHTANCKKLGIEKIRAYISAANLFTFSKYWGFDPEIAQNGNDFLGGVNRDLQLGVDRGAYPQPKTFLIGVNVIF
jgi:TonB-dependent starch-binding outer membrane protein SusC